MATSETPQALTGHGISECPNCGYCLRGATSFVCSECGMDVIAAREARRAKEAREESFYRAALCVTPVGSWLFCSLTGGWSVVLDNEKVCDTLSPVVWIIFNLPLHLFIAMAATFFLAVDIKSVGRVLVLVNLALVLSSIAIAICVWQFGP